MKENVKRVKKISICKSFTIRNVQHVKYGFREIKDVSICNVNVVLIFVIDVVHNFQGILVEKKKYGSNSRK